MEFEELGVHCHECKFRDYLPTTCSLCDSTFCAEHWKPDAHACSVRSKEGTSFLSIAPARVVTCADCKGTVLVKKNEVDAVKLQEHKAKGCAPRRRENKRCAVHSCRAREPVKIVCKRCDMQFCLRHRLELDHACTGKPLVASSSAGSMSPAMIPRLSPLVTVQE